MNNQLLYALNGKKIACFGSRRTAEPSLQLGVTTKSITTAKCHCTRTLSLPDHTHVASHAHALSVTPLSIGKCRHCIPQKNFLERPNNLHLPCIIEASDGIVNHCDWQTVFIVKGLSSQKFDNFFVLKYSF